MSYQPQTITYPDEFTIDIKLNGAVQVGENISISISYKSGDYDTHQPSLELFSGPDEYLENPKPFGIIVEKGKQTIFRFIADRVGIYTLRLRPFFSMETGRLLQIHSLSKEEIEAAKNIVSEMES